MCIGCDELLTTEHILLTCSDFIETRESHYSAQSLHILFQGISWENYLKAIIFVLADSKFSDHF